MLFHGSRTTMMSSCRRHHQPATGLRLRRTFASRISPISTCTSPTWSFSNRTGRRIPTCYCALARPLALSPSCRQEGEYASMKPYPQQSRAGRQPAGRIKNQSQSISGTPAHGEGVEIRFVQDVFTRDGTGVCLMAASIDVLSLPC